MKDLRLFGFGVNQVEVFCSAVLGALVLFVGFILWRRRSSTKVEHVESKNETNTKNSKALAGGKSENSKSSTVVSKRGKNKKRRETQQEFTHSWMVGALKGHTGTVLDMKFSSDGKFLASCAEDRTVQIWCTKDLATKERKSLRVNIDFDYATHIGFSPDGKSFIIHKSFGNNIEVYAMKKKSNGFFVSATPVLEYPKKHEEDIVAMDIACNGRFILTCGKTNDLIIWDFKGEILAQVDTVLGSTYKARISPCGRFIAASGFTPDVKVWEVGFSKTGDFKQVKKAFHLSGHSSSIYDLDFSVDSNYMASVSKDGTYRFYDTNVEFERGQDPRLLVSGTSDISKSAKVALSPNGEILAVADDAGLSFFSTADGKLDTTIENIGPVACMHFDATGEFLLAAVDRHIRIFRNIPGYRAAIKLAALKLKQKQTSATTERLKTLIAEKRKLLESMGESLTLS